MTKTRERKTKNCINKRCIQVEDHRVLIDGKDLKIEIERVF